MINAFIVKKYAALMLAAMLSTMLFFTGLTFYNLIYALGFLIVGVILSIIFGSLLLNNPFSGMLEGKGILVFDINSTGIIKTYILGVIPPFVKGNIGGRQVTDVFNRSTVYHLATPKKQKQKAEMTEEGGIKFNLSDKAYNASRFALFHYPVLIWNAQLSTLLTKDFLSEKEKDSFAEHGVLYLNRKMEELTSVVRDFGRHVVELTKPATSIFKSKWTWIIMVIALVILGALFAPSIINAIKQATQSGGGILPEGSLINPLP